MDIFKYLVLILFNCQAIGGNEEDNLQLFLRGSISRYRYGNYYYTSKQHRVDLICRHTQYRTTLCINQGIRRENSLLILRDAEIVSRTPGKYSVEEKHRRLTLTIQTGNEPDTSSYVCWSFQKEGDTNARILFNYTYLHVMEQNNALNFCDLVSGIDGVFFVGDAVLLKCPIDNNLHVGFELLGRGGSVMVQNQACDPIRGSPFCLISVGNIGRTWNGSSVFCKRNTGLVEKDFCRHIPQITVFEVLNVSLDLLEWNGTDGHAIVACRSIPSLLSPIEWDVVGNEVSVEGTRISNQLRINLKNYSENTVASFEITCRLSIGSRSSSTSVSFNTINITSMVIKGVANDLISVKPVTSSIHSDVKELTPTPNLTQEDRTRLILYIPIGCTVTMLVISSIGLVVIRRRLCLKHRKKSVRESTSVYHDQVLASKESALKNGTEMDTTRDENDYMYADTERNVAVINYVEDDVAVYQNVTNRPK